MTQDTAHMPLDERGLEAAREQPGTNHDGIIRAYLQTAAADVSGLVAQPCTCHPDDNPPSPCAEKYALSACLAASTLQTLSASNAALEAENERLRVALKRIIDAPLIDHRNPSNNAVAIARAALSAPKGGQDHG